jgi:endonuclease YncB( thermonuclease family)
MRRLLRDPVLWSLGCLLAAALLWHVAARGAEPRCYTATLVAVERVVDGDTYDLMLSVPVWIGLYADIRERVRLLGVDAWERSEPQGPVATGFVERWLLDSGYTEVQTCKRDNFGRALATIKSRIKGDLGQVLLREGHAKPYPEPKP